MQVVVMDDSGYEAIAAAAGTLLALARRAVVEVVTNGPAPLPGDLPTEPPLDQPSGVFVTLTAGGDLRGCIGVPEATLPMGEAVWIAARQAAVEDPRFPPVSEGELDHLTVAVSVLTPARPVDDADELVMGRDGVIFEYRGRRALYLPEVATETGWDTPTFLSNLALKAGLPADSWTAPEARLWSFRTVRCEGPLTAV
jgi:AmmeMemoRadiSam system protein A